MEPKPTEPTPSPESGTLLLARRVFAGYIYH